MFTITSAGEAQLLRARPYGSAPRIGCVHRRCRWVKGLVEAVEAAALALNIEVADLPRARRSARVRTRKARPASACQRSVKQVSIDCSYALQGRHADATGPPAPPIVLRLTNETCSTRWTPVRLLPKLSRLRHDGFRCAAGETATAIARDLHVSSTRIWKAFALQPHRVDTFKPGRIRYSSTECDIVGLYLDPPARALHRRGTCVDGYTGLPVSGRDTFGGVTQFVIRPLIRGRK